MCLWSKPDQRNRNKIAKSNIEKVFTIAVTKPNSGKTTAINERPWIIIPSTIELLRGSYNDAVTQAHERDRSHKANPNSSDKEVRKVNVPTMLAGELSRTAPGSPQTQCNKRDLVEYHGFAFIVR